MENIDTRWQWHPMIISFTLAWSPIGAYGLQATHIGLFYHSKVPEILQCEILKRPKTKCSFAHYYLITTLGFYLVPICWDICSPKLIVAKGALGLTQKIGPFPDFFEKLGYFLFTTYGHTVNKLRSWYGHLTYL